MRKTIPIVVGTTLASLALTGSAAQAQTTICQTGASYPTQPITLNGLSNAEIVATNAFGIANGGGGTLCLEVTTTSSDTATAGDFRISTNTSTVLNYPNVMRGQSYGEGPTGQSGMPIQVSQITSLPTGWDPLTPPPGPTEKWNNAIEFWLTTTKPTGRVDQADGTELMIWLNYSGDGINPAGAVVGQVTIAGILWDVHVGRADWGSEGGPIYWNYMAYVPADIGGARNRVSSIHTDFKAFFDDAKTRTGDCRTGASYTAGNDNAPFGPCVSNSWWVTSVQAGFEVWQNGVGLTSRSFTSMVNGVNTDRTGSDGRPIVNWSVPFDITQAGCSGGGGSATYAVYMPPGSATPVQAGNMTLDIASNVFKATIAPVYPNHGDAQLRVSLTCSTGTTTTNTNFYVDPSGRVTNSNNGQPIQGATVTLYYATTASGPFTVVPNGSIIMSPTNRRNPDLTSANGHYGWDVQNGQFYRVRAQKAGCTSPTNPAIPYVESPVVFVPPAVLNLDLQLSCPVQSANVVTFTDWGSGYCANVYVTNNSSVPWAWTATVPIDGTIYNIWNATSSANSGTVTMQGIAWNKMLAPGATTYSVGFCANRNTPPQPPGTPSVSITKTSDWGTGYCETVTVTNNTSARITWNVTIPVEGSIYNAWNAVYTPMGGGQVSMHGVSWNSSLAPGESTHDVGFCANR